jgi:hypothetical protein
MSRSRTAVTKISQSKETERTPKRKKAGKWKVKGKGNWERERNGKEKKRGERELKGRKSNGKKDIEKRFCKKKRLSPRVISLKKIIISRLILISRDTRDVK